MYKVWISVIQQSFTKKKLKSRFVQGGHCQLDTLVLLILLLLVCWCFFPFFLKKKKNIISYDIQNACKLHPYNMTECNRIKFLYCICEYVLWIEMNEEENTLFLMK